MADPSLVVIENSVNCNLWCSACPVVHAPFYPKTFMRMDVFQAVLNHIHSDMFPQCGLVGWGEPFLDPTYFEKLIRLKHRGFQVGSTSNILLLTPEIAARIVQCGLDQLQISLDLHHLKAAGIPESAFVKKIDSLLNMISQQASPLKVGLNMIAFKSHLPAILHLLEAIAHLPISSIGIAPLLMIPSISLLDELVTRAELVHLKKQIGDHYPHLPVSIQYLEESLTGCRSNVFQNVYVNYQGQVNPCCVLAMQFPNVTFDGKTNLTETVSFGNLTEVAFEDIWNHPSYVTFREGFARNGVPQVCHCCNVWRILPAFQHDTP